MIDLGFELTKIKERAIEKCSVIVYDEIPKTPADTDFKGKGFRGVTPLLRKEDDRPVMAHYEAG